jgi:ribosome-associated protein
MGRAANINEETNATPDTLDRALLAVKAAAEKKATETVVLDLRQVATFTEYFVICTGANARQVQAISNSVEEQLRNDGKRPLHIEGYSTGEWILLDYGDLIVHVFSSGARKFYDLERLWRDAGRVELPDNTKEQVRRSPE